MAPFDDAERPPQEGEAGGTPQPDLWSSEPADPGSEAAGGPLSGQGGEIGPAPPPELPPASAPAPASAPPPALVPAEAAGGEEPAGPALFPATVMPHFAGEPLVPPYTPPARRPALPPEEGWYSLRQPAAGAGTPEGAAGPSAATPGAQAPGSQGATSAAERPGGGRAGFFADVPADAPGSLPGILVVGGGFVGLVGLLLPWAGEMAVVGGGDLPQAGYTASWGLAAPTNWLVAAALVLLLGVALRTPPVRDSVRYGYLPLVVGLFALGNAWPYASYLLRGLGFGIGVWLGFAAAAAMVAGATLELRRKGSPPAV